MEMTWTNVIGICIIITVCYIFLYSIVDRICKAVEHTADAAAYGKISEKMILKKEDFNGEKR